MSERDRRPHSRESGRFSLTDGWAPDCTPESYAATYVCIPLRVRAPSAEQADQAVLDALTIVSKALDGNTMVEWIKSAQEAGYAFALNLDTNARADGLHPETAKLVLELAEAVQRGSQG